MASSRLAATVAEVLGPRAASTSPRMLIPAALTTSKSGSRVSRSPICSSRLPYSE